MFILISCVSDTVYISRRIKGESTKEILESNKKESCLLECDAQYHKKWCDQANVIDRLVLCKIQLSEKRCVKECYAIYCSCNENKEGKFYNMCNAWCNKMNNKE